MSPHLIRSSRLALALATSSLLMIAACAGRSSRSTTPLVGKVAEDIRPLEQDLQRARDEQVDAMAPRLFSLAEKAAKEARSKAESGEKEPKVYEQVAQARELLRQARVQSTHVREQLHDVIDARASAVRAGAPGLGRPFQEVEKGFRALALAVEKNDDVRIAFHRQEVLHGYQRLESMARQGSLLGRAQQAYFQALKEGALRYAPRTLAECRKAYELADAAIKKDAYGKEAEELSNKATFAAQRLLAITRESKSFSQWKPEETALWVERHLHQVGEGLGMKDARNQSLANQWDQVVQESEMLGERKGTEGETETKPAR